jgi:hypothetical protein
VQSNEVEIANRIEGHGWQDEGFCDLDDRMKGSRLPIQIGNGQVIHRLNVTSVTSIHSLHV